MYQAAMIARIFVILTCLGTTLSKPNAVANHHDIVLPFKRAYLDASESTGNIVGYKWAQLVGPKVTLLDSNKSVATLEKLPAGRLIFGLRVTDSSGESNTKLVFVDVKCKSDTCGHHELMSKGKCVPMDCENPAGLLQGRCVDCSLHDRVATMDSPANCRCNRGFDDMDGECIISCPVNSVRDGQTCTCINGYEMLFESCIPVCTANSTRKDGKCQCDSGYEKIGDKCLAVCTANSTRKKVFFWFRCRCDSGYEKVGDKCLAVCVTNSTRKNESCPCDSGYEKVRQKCLAVCTANSTRTYETCVCNAGYDQIGDKCLLACVSNSTRNSGVCTCNRGYQMIASKCYTACPPNSTRSGVDCKCDTGYAMIKDRCYADCPANSKRSGTACACDSGYTMISDKCYTNCRANSYRSGTNCVCKSGYRLDGSNCVVQSPYCNGKKSNYCHRPSKDCNGRNINMIMADAHGCKEACSKDCRCKSVQYSNSHCWLKFHKCADHELQSDWDASRRGDGQNDYYKC